MSYNIGNVIEAADIINVFTSTVINVATTNAYTRTNPPMDGAYQCVPVSMLDTVDSIPKPNVGVAGQKITASSIVSTLTSVTQNLTRIGTFTYVRRYKSTDRNGNVSYEVQATLNGKCIFTIDQIKNLTPVPGNGGVVANNPITISSINALCTACLNSWNSTAKYNYAWTNELCHSVCHNNCHSDCQCYGGQANCYSD